jgi:membrane-bound metal-dependent hydrolase YbcI (DUF457 family)
MGQKSAMDRPDPQARRRYAAAVPLPRIAALASLVTVAVADGLGLAVDRSRPVAGAIDETAHLATGVLVLSAWRSPDPAFAAGLLAGSVLIDTDHVPDAMGILLLRRGARPVTHSLATVAAAGLAGRRLAAAGLLPVAAVRGAMLGAVVHLGRDLATGTTGVPLLWPLSGRAYSMRYALYFGPLAALAVRSVRRPLQLDGAVGRGGHGAGGGGPRVQHDLDPPARVPPQRPPRGA